MTGALLMKGGLVKQEGLAVKRLKRKQLSRVAVGLHPVRSNQEWTLDVARDTPETGRGIRVLAVVDGAERWP